MPIAIVRPIRPTEWDDELGAHHRRTVAFRAVCADGYRGPSRDSWGAARDDAGQHNAEMHRAITRGCQSNTRGG